MVDAYYFFVGGAVGKHQGRARPIGYRAPATEVPAAIERLMRAYLGGRENGEGFRQFTARRTDDELRRFVAGAGAGAGARPPPPPAPPPRRGGAAGREGPARGGEPLRHET